MTVQDLRDVLRDRAESPSPANPARHEQVRLRIRRGRARRRMTAGVAVAAALAAVAFLLPGGGTTQEVKTADPPAGELPERFTAHDGTEYRRLATTTIKKEGAEKVSVTIPVTGRPLDVAALCQGGRGNVTPRVSVQGYRPGASPILSPCPSKGMELIPLLVPKGADRVTVTFDTTTSGRGCVRTKGGRCESPRLVRADWKLAVYEWIPPRQPAEPEPLRGLPGRVGRWTLSAFTSGVWPQDSAFTLVATGDGGKISLEQVCGGDLAGRVWFSYRIDGRDTHTSATCAVWKHGPFPMALYEFAVPKGKRVVVTGRIGSWGEHTNRPVRWSVGVYRR